MTDRVPETPEDRAARIRAAERAHDNHYAFREQSNGAAIESANVALRAFTLINGGAAVAMLALLGALSDRVTGEQLVLLAIPLSKFASGVAAGALAAGLAYLTNYSATSEAAHTLLTPKYPFIEETKQSKRWARAYTGFILIAIVAAFASLGFFVFGMLGVIDAMETVFTAVPNEAVAS